MYLDDYDDRPVMKRSRGEGAGKAAGQSGFGPLIKYPGYVDYDHPYFTDPYNRMPDLALTTRKSRFDNPCPPTSVRNWDGQGGDGPVGGARHRPGDSSRGGCHCAKKKRTDPKCPAALRPVRSQRLERKDAQDWGQEVGPQMSSPAMVCLCQPMGPQHMRPSPLPPGGMKYMCCPLPEN